MLVLQAGVVESNSGDPNALNVQDQNVESVALGGSNALDVGGLAVLNVGDLAVLNVGDPNAQNVQDPAAAQVVSAGVVVAPEHITAGTTKAGRLMLIKKYLYRSLELANILLIFLCSSVGYKRK